MASREIDLVHGDLLFRCLVRPAPFWYFIDLCQRKEHNEKISVILDQNQFIRKNIYIYSAPIRLFCCKCRSQIQRTRKYEMFDSLSSDIPSSLSAIRYVSFCSNMFSQFPDLGGYLGVRMLQAGYTNKNLNCRIFDKLWGSNICILLISKHCQDCQHFLEFPVKL